VRFGEIVDVDLLRDQKTGKSKGSAFIAYEDQRSTILAVDNFNGTQVRMKINELMARFSEGPFE
jgi:RNA-binding motif X-linked protein 2